MPAHLPCPFCSREAIFDELPDASKVSCKACGIYVITGTAKAVSKSMPQRALARAGFWVRDQNALGDEPRIESSALERVGILPDISIVERLDRLLRYAIAEQGSLGGVFSAYEAAAAGATHSGTTPEVTALASALLEQGHVRQGGQQGWLTVTPAGYIRAAENPQLASQSGFIAMWFDNEMNSAKIEGLEPALRDAEYNPVVVSGVEHVGKIDDEIVSQIRKSRFLVADFTGHRGGVYFEAGFALGLGLPVFWTCKNDHMDKLHFDIRRTTVSIGLIRPICERA